MDGWKSSYRPLNQTPNAVIGLREIFTVLKIETNSAVCFHLYVSCVLLGTLALQGIAELM